MILMIPRGDVTKPVRREHKRYSTGDPYLDLLGAVIRQAMRDAKRDLAAAAWVQAVAPALAHKIQARNPVVTAQESTHSTKRRKTYKHTTSTAIVDSGPSCEVTIKHSHTKG